MRQTLNDEWFLWEKKNNTLRHAESKSSIAPSRRRFLIHERSSDAVPKKGNVSYNSFGESRQKQ